MSNFMVFMRYELWVNVPVAIFLGTVDWPALTPVGLNGSFGLERYVRIRKDKASIPGQASFFLYFRFFFDR